MSELRWLFWALILALYFESWARVWALYHRNPGAESSAGSAASDG